MEISQLKAFAAVASHGSFSAAADELNLTQPAVSKRVAQLEERLGLALFLRHGHKIALTDHGNTLLPRANAILAEVANTQQMLAARMETPSGIVRIGTSHHIGLHRLPPILARYTRKYPEVDLRLQFQSSEAACAAVSDGLLDLAMVTLPTDLPSGVSSRTIWQDQMDVCVPASHAQDAQLDAITYLNEQPAILPSSGTHTRRLIDQACARIELMPNVRMTTDFLETIKMMVSVGLGWSVLPKSMHSRETPALNISGFHASRALGAVYPNIGPLSSAAEHFIASGD